MGEWRIGSYAEPPIPSLVPQAEPVTAVVVSKENVGVCIVAESIYS